MTRQPQKQCMKQRDLVNQLRKFKLGPDRIEKVISLITDSSLSTDECWRHLSKRILATTDPIQLHQYLHQKVYLPSDITPELAPVWVPDKDELEQSNIYQLMHELDMSDYQDFYDWSISSPADFWARIISDLQIFFHQAPQQIFDFSTTPSDRGWLVGSRLNIVDSCFQGDEQAVAIVTQNGDGSIINYTYQQLERLVNQVSHSLIKMGVKTDTPIGIIMPMTVESIAIYLACIKIGAVAVTIADSFASTEIAVRFQIAGARLVFTQDYVHRTGKQLPLYEKVIAAQAEQVIVIKTITDNKLFLRKKDCLWKDFLDSDFDEPHRSVSRLPSDYCNILFSSGTTGPPKAIPWTHATPIKSAADAYLHHDIKVGDCLCWPTSLGWMMGPWLVFSALINKARIALYPDVATGRNFFTFVETTKVTMLGLVPSLVSKWRKDGLAGSVDWSSIRVFSSTGECSNPDDMFFLMSQANYKPIIEYCGGTEIGGGYITGTVVQPNIPSTFSTPALGSRFLILDEAGKQTDEGEVFLIPPALGLSTELLNADHYKAYYASTPTDNLLRRHGDQIAHLPNGYFRVNGRVDDAMNLGGIKTSCNQIETVLSKLDFVRESAAIAVPAIGGGPSNLVIYLVPESDKISKIEMLDEMQLAIHQGLNPLFKIKDCFLVNNLPRTASNKIMRRKLRQAYEDQSANL